MVWVNGEIDDFVAAPRRRVVKRTKRTKRGRRVMRSKKKSYKKAGNFASQSFTMLFNTVTVNPTFTLFGSFAPSLSNIPAAELTGYQALYDEFRITSIGINVKNITNQNNANILPFEVYSVIDKSDTGSISVAQALQYANCKKRLSTDKNPVYRRFRPSLTTIQYDVNGNSMIRCDGSPWLQLSNSSAIPLGIVASDTLTGAPVSQTVTPNQSIIAHLGCKVTSNPNPVGGAAQVFEVYVTLNVQFKVKN